MFQFRWLRRLVRKHTNPIPEERAVSMKRKLSLLYMLLSWNAFGFVCYMLYTGRSDWAHAYGFKSDTERALSPAQQWAKTLKIEKARVIRMSGFHKKHEYDYESKTENLEENARASTDVHQ